MRRIASTEDLRYFAILPLVLLLAGIAYSGVGLERLLTWIDPETRPRD